MFPSSLFVLPETLRHFTVLLISLSPKDDKDIVLAALKQDQRALEFASARLKNDPEILSALTASRVSRDGSW